MGADVDGMVNGGAAHAAGGMADVGGTSGSARGFNVDAVDVDASPALGALATFGPLPLFAALDCFARERRRAGGRGYHGLLAEYQPELLMSNLSEIRGSTLARRYPYAGAGRRRWSGI
ncbi:hypothetical protein GN244_ATG19810 [Phytophthora infestans]|nr:hypothetical protein GN244_ATG19810 [Phytophthora infestans]